MGNIHLVTGHAGQEHVTAADQGAFNASIFGSGQFVFDKGNNLAASVTTNNKIRVLDGDILMQGRHIRLNEDTYVDLTIENGTQGYYRNDLIVVRYTKDSGTGVEDCNLVVIKGENATSNPVDPAYTSGDILNDHAILNDMPLYRVALNGINVQELVPLFTVADTGFAQKKHTHAPSEVGMIAVYSVELTFTDGIAEYSNAAIKSNSVCFAQRRSGAVGYEHSFSVHSFDGKVRLCCEGATGVVNVNLLIINN